MNVHPRRARPSTVTPTVTPRARGFALLAAVAGIVTVSQACRSATQVTLVVETSEPCSDVGLKSVAIVVGNSPADTEAKVEGRFVTATTTECADHRVGTLVITPADDGEHGSVVVIGGIDRAGEECTPSTGYKGCIVARRTFSFVEHAGLVLPVRLDLDCKDVACDAVSTCKDKGCVSSNAQCSGDDCSTFGVGDDGGTAFVDASMPVTDDASTVFDAESDARIPDAGGCVPKEAFACPPRDEVCSASQTCCASGLDPVPEPQGPTPLDAAIEDPNLVDAAALDASVIDGGIKDGGALHGYACRDASECLAGNYALTCTSAKHCPGDEVCCMSKTGMTTCAASCTGSQLQACNADCECPAGNTCTDTVTFAGVTLHRCVAQP